MVSPVLKKGARGGNMVSPREAAHCAACASRTTSRRNGSPSPIGSASSSSAKRRPSHTALAIVPGAQAVADRSDGQDAGPGPVPPPGEQLLGDPVPWQPRRDEHDSVARDHPLAFGVNACEAGLGSLDPEERMLGLELDAAFDEAAVDPRMLHRVHAPLRDARSRRDEPHRVALRGEQLGERAAEVVVVVVEDEDPLARGPGAAEEVVGREDLDRVAEGERSRVPAADAVGPPACAGRDRDVLEAVAEDLLGRHLALERLLDVREARELSAPVVGDPDPGGEPGQPCLPEDAAAELPRRLGQHDVVPALAEPHRSLESGGAGADDEHPRLGPARAVALRMPPSAPLLAHGGVLRAADRRRGPVAGDADVAADALADVLEAALFDLPRQEGIRDRGARRADQVEHAVADEPHHRVRRRQPADADDRLRGQLLEAAEVLLGPRLVPEARRQRVVLPEADHQVPQVGQLADETEELVGRRALDPVGAEQLVDDEAAGDRSAAVTLVERVLEHLAEQSCPVREAAAVLVVAEVGAGREEVLKRRQPMGGVDVDDVVARGERPRDGLPVTPPQAGDVLPRHPPRLDRLVSRHGEVRRALGRDAPVEVAGGHAPVDELDPGQRAVGVHLVDEEGVRRDVLVVPDPSLDEAADVRALVELHLLGADDRPAALGLHPAHHGVRCRVAIAHPVAVRHLEEAVPGRHRADPHRLEQDVVARVAHRSGH